MASNPTRVGVVAIGRNEGDRLRRCLTSIDAPVPPLVYVDSGSTDGSATLAAELGAHVVDLELDRPFTAARARNAGWMALLDLHPEVDYVQFVDGDCEFEQGWMAAAVGFLDSRPDVAVVCGRRRERFPEQSFYNRLCDDEWNTPIGEAAASGGDAMVRKTALVGVGGYNPDLAAGEEPELCFRLRAAGWRIWRLDAAMTIHDAAMHRFRQWWLRTVRSGLGYAQGWRMTCRSPNPLYRREVLRALGWTFGVAGFAIVLAVAMDRRLLIVAPLIWILQFVRLSVRNGPAVAIFLLLGKAAEARGVLTFLARAMRGAKGGTVFYK